MVANHDLGNRPQRIVRVAGEMLADANFVRLVDARKHPPLDAPPARIVAALRPRPLTSSSTMRPFRSRIYSTRAEPFFASTSSPRRS